MKIGICIIVYNLHPEIFILQMKAIKKYCKDEDYVIEIFDNSSDEKKANNIQYQAELQEVKYTRTHATSQNGSDSHVWACNLSYEKIKKDYQAFFYCDHDAIPIKEFSIEEILKDGQAMAGLGQGSKKTYFWAGMVMWVANRVDDELIDFSVSHELNLDTGGMLYKVVEKYGKEGCIFFNEEYYQNPYFNGARNNYATINNNMFLHITNSSNWSGDERHEERINSMINVVKEKTGL